MLVRHNQVSDGVKYGSIRVAARSDLKEVFVGAAESVLQGYIVTVPHMFRTRRYDHTGVSTINGG
jgi:hypothetical protein